MRMHEEVLAPRQRKVLKILSPQAARHGFYLGGGTAVALHLGHRRSVDLDWFSETSVGDVTRLARTLGDGRMPMMIDQIGPGTLHGAVAGVRVSVLEYPYALLHPPLVWSDYGCPVASLDDLACMKLSAVAQRGSKRDFVDVYALGREHRPLEELLRLYRRRYGVEDIAHVLQGLVYFDDAERDRMPRMLWDIDWKRVKQTILGWVKRLTS